MSMAMPDTLTCESNLTFDGEALNISWRIDCSCRSVSLVSLKDDGRFLTNVSGAGNATGQGS